MTFFSAAGVATHYVTKDKLPDLEGRLMKATSPKDVDNILEDYSGLKAIGGTNRENF
jgi:hypothetical protein